MTAKYYAAHKLFWDIKYLREEIKRDACYIAGVSSNPARRARAYRDSVAAAKAGALVSELIRMEALKAEARLLCNK